LRTIEQHDQGKLVMRLLGYGNSVKPPKECLEASLPAKNGGGLEQFQCVDMLTEEHRGAQVVVLVVVCVGNVKCVRHLCGTWVCVRVEKGDVRKRERERGEVWE
jgi:hypothetical protein